MRAKTKILIVLLLSFLFVHEDCPEEKRGNELHYASVHDLSDAVQSGLKEELRKIKITKTIEKEGRILEEREAVSVGDLLTARVKIDNPSSIDITSFYLKDHINPEHFFIEGQNQGVYGPLNSKSEINVSYNIIPKAQGFRYEMWSCIVDFRFQNAFIRWFGTSNDYEIVVEPPSITIEQFADKKKVKLNEPFFQVVLVQNNTKMNISKVKIVKYDESRLGYSDNDPGREIELNGEKKKVVVSRLKFGTAGRPVLSKLAITKMLADGREFKYAVGYVTSNEEEIEVEPFRLPKRRVVTFPLSTEQRIDHLTFLLVTLCTNAAIYGLCVLFKIFWTSKIGTHPLINTLFSFIFACICGFFSTLVISAIYFLTQYFSFFAPPIWAVSTVLIATISLLLSIRIEFTHNILIDAAAAAAVLTIFSSLFSIAALVLGIVNVSPEFQYFSVELFMLISSVFALGFRIVLWRRE